MYKYSLYNNPILKIVYIINCSILLVFNISYTLDLFDIDLYTHIVSALGAHNIELLVKIFRLKSLKILVYLYICLFVMSNLILVRFGTITIESLDIKHNKFNRFIKRTRKSNIYLRSAAPNACRTRMLNAIHSLVNYSILLCQNTVRFTLSTEGANEIFYFNMYFLGMLARHIYIANF